MWKRNQTTGRIKSEEAEPDPYFIHRGSHRDGFNLDNQLCEPLQCGELWIMEADLNYTSTSISHQFKWHWDEEEAKWVYISGFIHECLMVNLMPGRIHFYQVCVDYTSDHN